MNRKILILVGILVIGILASWFIVDISERNEEEVEEIIQDESADWKTFNHPYFNFKIDFPSDWWGSVDEYVWSPGSIGLSDEVFAFCPLDYDQEECTSPSGPGGPVSVNGPILLFVCVDGSWKAPNENCETEEKFNNHYSANIWEPKLEEAKKRVNLSDRGEKIRAELILFDSVYETVFNDMVLTFEEAVVEESEEESYRQKEEKQELTLGEIAEWETYKNIEYGFEFKYPNLENWRLTEEPQDEKLLEMSIFNLENENQDFNIRLSVWDLSVFDKELFELHNPEKGHYRYDYERGTFYAIFPGEEKEIDSINEIVDIARMPLIKTKDNFRILTFQNGSYGSLRVDYWIFNIAKDMVISFDLIFRDEDVLIRSEIPGKEIMEEQEMIIDELKGEINQIISTFNFL